MNKQQRTEMLVKLTISLIDSGHGELTKGVMDNEDGEEDEVYSVVLIAMELLDDIEKVSDRDAMVAWQVRRAWQAVGEGEGGEDGTAK
jgi:hypothetical protein